jgi:UDPglucose 6-dehydrogenase
MKARNIATIGLWHLGEIYSAGLAELGCDVVGIDENEAVIKNLSNGIPPLPEPGLSELIAKNGKEGRLRYTTDFSEIGKCGIVWCTFDTPVDDRDDPQMAAIYAVLDKTTPYLQKEIVFVMTSQVPVGTSEKIITLIRGKRPEVKVHYAYTPENLRLGEAVRGFLKPERIVIGADDEMARKTLEDIFSPLEAEFITMSVASAEMAKHALNAFLATSLSFINDIADICEAEGADVLDVVRALKSDPRIGKGAFLGAGLGFSGGTLGRDLRALGSAAREHGISARVIDSVWEKNDDREKELAWRFLDFLGGAKGKRIAIFGVIYKAGTTTLRRSQAIELADRLHTAGLEVKLYDPHALQKEVSGVTNLPFFTDPYEAAKDCDGILIATPWPEFKEIDFGHLAKACHKSAVIFDANNFLYNEYETKIKGAGLVYKGVGRTL